MAQPALQEQVHPDARRLVGSVRMVEAVEFGYLSLESAARYLDTSTRTVRRWIQEHALPHYYIGGSQRGKLLFRKGEIDQWMRKRERRNAFPCQGEAGDDGLDTEPEERL